MFIEINLREKMAIVLFLQSPEIKHRTTPQYNCQYNW